MLSLEIGTTVDSRYEIIACLGRGRAGTAFSARDILLSRTVALKVLNPALMNDPDFVSRFVREAQTLGGIDHQNIVRCFDLIPESAFGAYLVTELVEGISLEELLQQQGKLSPADALAIAVQICDAAEALRVKQLVHRDLKPSNVMLENRSDQRLVKIIDFGLVGWGQAVSADKMRLTKPDLLIGSPAFMSPEQIRGAEIDHRSDIFSIGCILHKLITGKNTVWADNILDTLILQLSKRPERLSASIGAVPVGLQESLDQAVAKNAGERWQTANEFKEALEAVLDGLLPRQKTTTFCSVCGRPERTKGSNASLTGWIFSCSCRQVLAKPASLDICVTCKKPVYKQSSGSITQWIFSSSNCACKQPQIAELEDISLLDTTDGVTQNPTVETSGKRKGTIAIVSIFIVLTTSIALAIRNSSRPASESKTVVETTWKPIASLASVKKFNAEENFSFALTMEHGRWQARAFDVNNEDLLKLKPLVEAFPPFANARQKGQVLPGIVRLNNCSIDGGGNLGAISDLGIVLLDLSRTKIDDRALDELHSFTHLDELNLKNNDLITSKIGNHLSAVPNLSTLRVSGRNINSASLDSLARLKNLNWLDLGDIAISNREINSLSRIKHLSIVGFERCTITNAGYKALAGWKQIQQLRLIRMNISNQDFDNLSKLNGLRTLAFVECAGLSEPQLQKLRSKLTACKIRLYGDNNK